MAVSFETYRTADIDAKLKAMHIRPLDIMLTGVTGVRNQPDDILLKFLDEQAVSILKRVKEATGVSILKPVPYSAEYGWNVQKVFDFIIDHMPTGRRQLMK